MGGYSLVIGDDEDEVAIGFGKSGLIKGYLKHEV